ncbi:damage-inducible protein CinA [Facklamia sp. HMSC062C11]|uniref:CinA family protein n=1 Tax=Facklamia sp. HMSC062C11 TaxID=1739262 RepID=UPI0008A3F6D6|nr:CinA family protein [Facklamia sp. HMSC062C11]OFL68143.1 damage-inducible protein CinA [Facklamia sp. HMSC062C11]
MKAIVIKLSAESDKEKISVRQEVKTIEAISAYGIESSYQSIKDNPQILGEKLSLLSTEYDLMLIIGSEILIDRSLIFDILQNHYFLEHFSIAFVNEQKQVIRLFNGEKNSDSLKSIYLLPNVSNVEDQLFNESIRAILQDFMTWNASSQMKCLNFLMDNKSSFQEIILSQMKSFKVKKYLIMEDEGIMQLILFDSINTTNFIDQMSQLFPQNYLASGINFSLEEWLVRRLSQRRQTISTAESITAGLVSSRLSMVSGASQVLKGGMVVYQSIMKDVLLGIDNQLTIGDHVYSHACAKAMARAIQTKTQSDFGLSLTGVAGPGGDMGHPAGQVFIGIAQKGHEVESYKYQFNFNDRNQVRIRACRQALLLLAQKILSNKCS